MKVSTAPQITITVAGPAQAALIAALHTECLGAPWSEASVARLLRLPGTVALLIHGSKNRPLGFVLGLATTDEQDARVVEIASLGVCQGERRRGHGARLIKALVEQARLNSYSSILLEVAADNDGAITLYHASGFQNIGRRANYYPPAPMIEAGSNNGVESSSENRDAILMRCDI